MASNKSMGLSMKLKSGLAATRGESEKSITYSILNEANKERGPPGFQTQGRCHQNSKTGVPVAPQKGHISSKNSEKERKINRNLNNIRQNQYKNMMDNDAALNKNGFMI